MRTYTWSRIPSDYIPFVEYDMPANAATSTDVQSDAFAEVVLANLIAPIQEDKKQSVSTNTQWRHYHWIRHYISRGAFTGTRVGRRDSFQDGDTWRLLKHDGEELPATPGVKGDRTYLADATLTAGSYWVDVISYYYIRFIFESFSKILVIPTT